MRGKLVYTYNNYSCVHIGICLMVIGDNINNKDNVEYKILG